MKQDHNVSVYFPHTSAAGQLIATINAMHDGEQRIYRKQTQKSERWTGPA